MENENYLTIKEISIKYGVSENTIFGWIRKGLIKVLKRNSVKKSNCGITVINESDFELFILAFNLIHKKDLSYYDKITKK